MAIWESKSKKDLEEFDRPPKSLLLHQTRFWGDAANWTDGGPRSDRDATLHILPESQGICCDYYSTRASHQLYF